MLFALLLACTEYDVSVKTEPPATPDDTALPPDDTGEPPPVPPEDCNGQDDDGDGLVDEDFGDADADGTADCLDAELCDGVDNDGDGQVDEGFDSDADSVPDCADVETCDGIDNDGDVEVDEGFDSDADGVPDCSDAEACDYVDNDGDGLVDEGFDADGDGIVDCDERTYAVELVLTADDAWEGWLDGGAIGGDGGWNTVERYATTLDSGSHVFGIHAMDTGAAIAGFIAAVYVDGAIVSLSGDGAWRVAEAVPSDPAWTTTAFDDSAWGVGSPCASSEVSRYWGSAPAELTSLGAQWIWPRGCTALDQAALRLTLSLP